MNDSKSAISDIFRYYAEGFRLGVLLGMDIMNPPQKNLDPTEKPD